MTTLSNPASVADRYQTYFNRKLLKVQTDALVLDQFGLQADLPSKAGGRTMRFFKPELAHTQLYSAPTHANSVQALSEGVAISAYRENTWTKVDVTLKQYGEATKISDIVDMTDAYMCVKQNIELMGRDAALHTDTVIRNALVGSTHPDGATTPLTHGSDGTNGCELFKTDTNAIINSGTSATNFATLSGKTKAEGAATRLWVLAAATRLAVNKAPKIKNGRYVCVLPPQVRHDLVQDDSYENAFQGNGAQGIYKGAMADIDGFIFVEATNPFIEDETYGTYDSTDDNADGLIYTTFFLGLNAYGVPKLAGTKSPLKPQVFINDKADKSDPLNQFIIAGWKAYYMAIGLDSLNIVAGRSKSTFA